MSELIAIFFGMALVNNMVLSKFLGLCPFFGVSKKLSSATVSETGTIAEKLRKLSPGGQEIVDRWELEKR